MKTTISCILTSLIRIVLKIHMGFENRLNSEVPRQETGKPSVVSENGILNRAKVQKNLEEVRAQREQYATKDAAALQKLRQEMGLPTTETSNESGARVSSPENATKRIAEKNEAGTQETSAEKSPSVPILQRMIDSYTLISENPEKDALEALYNRLDPKLSVAEKGAALKKIVAEYHAHQNASAKNQEKSPAKSDATPSIETDATDAKKEAGAQETKAEKATEAPILQQMIDAYKLVSEDPKRAALEALYDRLDPTLSMEQKQDAMKKLNDEYEAYQKNRGE